MSDGDTWTAHDVTDGRLFCYASSLWLAAMAILLALFELVIALDVPLPAARLAFLVTASSGLLFAGVYYEQLINGLTRAIVWLHPTVAVEDGGGA